MSWIDNDRVLRAIMRQRMADLQLQPDTTADDEQHAAAAAPAAPPAAAPAAPADPKQCLAQALTAHARPLRPADVMAAIAAERQRQLESARAAHAMVKAHHAAKEKQ